MRPKWIRAFPLVALLIVCSAPAVAQEPGEGLKVDRLQFPVTLSDGSSQTIVGYLYYHGSFRNRPLQVLLHGATYTHTYWDFPTVQGRTYSYARYMADPQRKYAVLALDLLAAGESSKPADGLSVTLLDTAGTVKQVIDRLRSGDNGAHYAFERIVLVGHSSGAIAAIFVQATWHPADALVVTAARHATSFPFSPGIQLVLPYVPTLAALSYFYLPPELRTALFYYAPAADPLVIAADNATADAWTGGQVTSTFAAFLYPLLYPEIDGVSQVAGPVLIQLGESDALFPAANPEAESALWATPPAIQVLPGIGHDFNLHRNHEQSWAGIASWLSETLGWRR